MLDTSNDSFFNGVQQIPGVLDVPDDTPPSTQTEDFRLALEDAKRAMLEDPLLKRPATIGLTDDDFSSRPYFRRDSWDEFELQFIHREIMSRVVTTFFDTDDYRR